MAYSAQADLERAVGGAAKLVQLTAPPGSVVADQAAVDAAIEAADSLIDSYAAKRYAVPLVDPVPTVVKNLSAKIAARVLRREKLVPLHTDPDDETTDRKWLEGVSDGTISLGVDPPPAKSSLVTDKAGQRESTKAVSRERLKGFW